jgi:hypothetical protein
MRRIYSLLGLSLGLLLLFGTVGCFGGGDGGDGEGGGGAGACNADADCIDNTKKCNTNTHECVSKCQGIICDAGQTCEATTGHCVGGGCSTDADCNDATKRCDTATSTCVPKCQGVVCNTGETCNQTTGQCEANGGGSCNTDTDCDPNGTNDQVCDGGTCKMGQFGDCSSMACATGMDCITIQGNQGTSQTCFLKCTDSSVCDFGLWCDPDSSSSTAGHCTSNLCGPTLGQYGLQQMNFLEACDGTAPGSQDGVCVGPLADWGNAGTPLEIGLCIAVGTIPAGDTCPTDAKNGETQKLCASGFCVSTTQGAAQGNCRSYCRFLDGVDCPADSTGPTKCMPFGGLAGVCIPQDANPVAAGQSCTPAQDKEVCVEDSVCLDPNGGQNNACYSFCDTRSGTCASGTCRPLQQGDLLGLCQ